MCIKGDPSEEACLTTEHDTFVMRLVESSNAHLLVPGVFSAGEDFPPVVASVDRYLELKPSVPRLAKLRQLLSRRVYDGLAEVDEEDNEDGTHGPPLTYDFLSRTIQCSDAQLEEGLRAMHAVNMGGEFRLLADGLRLDIIRGIAHVIAENDWAAHAVPVDGLLDGMAKDFDFPTPCVVHCMSLLSAESHLPESTFSYVKEKLFYFEAERMLRDSPKWRKEEFVSTLQDAIGEENMLPLAALKVRPVHNTREAARRAELSVYVSWYRRRALRCMSQVLILGTCNMSLPTTFP